MGFQLGLRAVVVAARGSQRVGGGGGIGGKKADVAREHFQQRRGGEHRDRAKANDGGRHQQRAQRRAAFTADGAQRRAGRGRRFRFALRFSQARLLACEGQDALLLFRRQRGLRGGQGIELAGEVFLRGAFHVCAASFPGVAGRPMRARYCCLSLARPRDRRTLTACSFMDSARAMSRLDSIR